MRFLPLLPLVSLLAVVACAEDVTAGKPHAEVHAAPVAPATPVAPPVAAPVQAPTAGTAHPIDKARSTVKALGAKITDKHEMGFADISGDVRLDGETVAGLAFTVQVGSLQASPEKLANHLKSPDFFDATQFPTATFTSTEVKADASVPGSTHAVTGDLTLRGVTQRVTFPALLQVTPAEVTGHTEFSINRKDFGIVYPGKPDNLIQDGVVLTVDLAAPRG